MLCIILRRSFTEDLVEILVRSSLRGPFMQILQMPCLTGACMKALVGVSWEVLVSRSCEIRSSSSRSFHDNLVTFSQGPWHEDLGPGLVQVLVRNSCVPARCCQKPFCMTLYRSLWEALEEVPVKSSRCPYMVSCRSLCADLVEILLTSSSRSLR